MEFLDISFRYKGKTYKCQNDGAVYCSTTSILMPYFLKEPTKKAIKQFKEFLDERSSACIEV